MQNWQFHEELKQLNIQSYDFDNKKVGDIVNGNKLKWKVEAIDYDPTTNFKAVAYSNGNNLVFSYVGTDPKNPLDWKNNIIDMKFKKYNSQFPKADNWTQQISNNPKFQSYIKYSTGHSEGGTEAVLIGKKYGYDTVTFNAYNAKSIIDKSPDIFNRNPNIINYGIDTDLTYNLGKDLHIGEMRTFPGYKANWKPVNNLYKSHDLEGFPALDKAKIDSGSKNHYLKDNFDKPVTGVYTGLSNSSGVSDQLITIPQNIPSFNLEALAALGNLGTASGSVFGAVMGMVTGLVGTAAGVALGGAIGNAMNPGVPTGVGTSIVDGNNAYITGVNGVPMRFHQGGVVPGQGEVPTILKGGETVRTKAQEEELKQALYDKYVGNFIPTVCGESNQPQRQQEVTPAQNKPIHQQITKDDELFILNMVCDAIDRNRNGLRTKIQAV